MRKVRSERASTEMWKVTTQFVSVFLYLCIEKVIGFAYSSSKLAYTTRPFLFIFHFKVVLNVATLYLKGYIFVVHVFQFIVIIDMK